MAVYRTKLMAAALKVQAAEGTAVVPALATDALRIAGAPPTVTLAWTEDGTREVVTGRFGSAGRAAPVGATVSVEIPLELHGKGSAYIPADVPSVGLDAALRIGGFQKSDGGLSDIFYRDYESGLEVGTLYIYAGDGLLYQALDCVAKLKVTLDAGRPGLLTASIVGTLATLPTAAAIAGLALPTVIPAPWTGATLTTLGTWSTASAAPNQLSARKAELTMNETVTERPWAGANGLRGRVIVDRTPQLSLEVEVVALTTYDPFTEAAAAKSPASTSPRFSTVIPGGAGNTVAVSTGVFAHGFPQPLDLGGLAGWGLQGPIVQQTHAGGSYTAEIRFS